MDFTSFLLALAPIVCESTAKRISYIENLDQRALSLQTSINELKAMRDDLKRQIDRDELKGRTCTNHAKEWLKAVEISETNTSFIMEKLAPKRTFLDCCFGTNCYAKYKLGKKVSIMLKNINELRERADNIHVDGGLHQEPSTEIPSVPAIGLGTMIEQVLGFLAVEETGIVGIYGLGGVGKTTLLQNVNNELITKTHNYDVVIWVTVSKEFVADKIQHVIEARLGLSREESEKEEHRASRIYRVMRRKRFLLLLDDVWEGIAFEKIGIPRPNKENKSKVIFTTRSMDVCSTMDAQRKLKVEFLSQENSWELFCEKVGRQDILEAPSIRPLAETIVRKCGGLPLALITMGRAMANRETEEEWMHAIEVLNKFPTEVRGMEDVFTLLKFSYDNLESDLLRACFLYCALFPEDYSIEKEQLVEYWIGEGFLAGSRGINANFKGYTLIGDLKAACLLETGEEKTQVKMHDVVRSFGLWVASECGTNKRLILVEPSVWLTEAPEAENWREALVISLLDNRIRMLPEEPECLKLTTLLLQWNSSLKKIPDRFFRHMPVLRVLDLSFTSLAEIPASIGFLVELYHLDLSGTRISTLPKELGNLWKLKHLDLQRTRFLQTIPRDAICGLTKLEVLNLYYSYASWELQSSEIEDEELRFSDLALLEHLSTLGVTVISLETLKELNEFNQLHNHIQYLYIEACNGLFYLHFPSNSNHGRRLRRLSIKNCHDLQYLEVSADAGDKGLPGLEVLTLHSLPNLTKVWRNSITQKCLRNLGCVNIWRCHKLKKLSWVLQLPKLEVLYLFHCREMEEVASEEESLLFEDPMSFPSLRILSIRDLPELRSIVPYRLSFPKLKSIAIVDCPKLNKLPLKASMETKLPTVYGDKEWWDGLEWDGTSSEHVCIPCFLPN